MATARPMMAILARTFRSPLFGEQTSYLRGIVKIARKKGMRGYVFSAGDVDWARLRVRGWIPVGGGWQRRWFPLPDVVYDRAWGLGPHKQKEHRDALSLLEQRGIVHFNPDFGDKIDVYNLMAVEADLALHLPETLPLTAANLAALGAKYRTLYLKPARGRQGKGIFKCIKLSDGWRLERAGAKRSLAARKTSDEAIVAACAKAKPDERYLVQQGLDLLHVAKGTVDIRVIVQRDRRGHWGVSAVGVRAGKPGSLVSNLHAGGKALTLSALARKARLRQSARDLKKRIAEVALLAASVLSQSFPTLGELGVDIGLDTNGRIWILELNRQPGRALFARARLRRAWRRSRVRVVEYAKYLATSRSAFLPPTDQA